MPLRNSLAGSDAGAENHAARLAYEAERAAELRALATHPDVVALRVERVRLQVDRLMWTGIVLGLAFTMANVQTLAAIGQAPWSPPWLVAWLLDPMVSLVLVAVLRAEQVTSRWQVQTGPWVRAARWTALGATYVMNTWAAWAELDGRLILLHSVPPLIVFVAAEAVTDLRERLTDAVQAAAADAAPRREVSGSEPATSLSMALTRERARTAPVSAVYVPSSTLEPEDADECPAEAAETGDDGHASERAGRPDSSDARVTELVDLLRDDVPVTGEQAGVIFAVSDRTGRRLLAEARRATAGSGTDSRSEGTATTAGDATCLPGEQTTPTVVPVLLRSLHGQNLEVSA